MKRSDIVFIVAWIAFWLTFCILLQVFRPEWAFNDINLTANITN